MRRAETSHGSASILSASPPMLRIEIEDALSNRSGTPPTRIWVALPPPNVRAKHRNLTAFVWRQASRIAHRITRTLTLRPFYSAKPAAFRETILSQIRADALRPTARHLEIADGEIRPFKRRDENGARISEFASSDDNVDLHPRNRWRKRPLVSIVRRMYGVDRIGSGSALARSRSPAMAAVCPFTTASRAAPEILIQTILQICRMVPKLLWSWG